MPSLFDVLFPPFCIGCKKIGTSLCAACARGLCPVPHQVCPYCFQISKTGHTHDRCRRENQLDGAVAIIAYNALARKLMKQLKYARAHRTFLDVFQTVPPSWFYPIDQLFSFYPHALFQPIPLHPKRLRKRGFNQADIIISFLQRRYKPQSLDVLQRVINTAPQAQTASRPLRQKNIAGAFRCTNTDRIPGTDIFLVDDLFTSGSTAKEAARVLKHQGARSVFVIAVAHGF